MKILEKKPLSEYTTFKMGGVAELMYVPETVQELSDCYKTHPSIFNYIIGGGSNLLINDEKSFDEVLSLREFNQLIDDKGDGRYYIGASVRLQKAIVRVNQDGYGGIEYLFSVPGLIGGAVFMNAGRGKKHNKCISDFILEVDYLENGEIKTLSREDCCFSYRSSVFQRMNHVIIIGATFQFAKISQEESMTAINERIELCKRVQDMSYPNFGTVFCESNKYIIRIAKILNWGYKDGVAYSSKTANWLLNREKGTFVQAVSLIKRMEKVHRIFRQNCRSEVIIWK